MLLKAQYRQTLDFSLKGIEESKAVAEKFINLLSDLDAIKNKTGNRKINVKKLIDQNRKTLIAALDDDLNISLFLSALFDFMNQINKSLTLLNQSQAREIKKYILEVDSILGFAEKLYDQYRTALKKLSASQEIKKFIEERIEAKRAGDFNKADKLRDKLAQKGLGIKDTKDGYALKLLNFFN
jgi:cysteinyl-tRNA synthetase